METKFENGKFEKIPGTERDLVADLVLLALGFTGPEQNEFIKELNVTIDERGNIKRDSKFSSEVEGVFVCGDAGRGQSLIVWAIAEGRSTAAAVDEFLVGRTQLPAPIAPTDRSFSI